LRTDCPFCYEAIKERIADRFGSVVAVADRFPVTAGHHLIITCRHTRDLFTMTSEEKQDALKLITKLRLKILDQDPAVTGFNVGINCGLSAGQTIFHAHIHLIPRRDGDVIDPRGGVRGVIPGKMAY
jgi:diadenosine tetraphosphate (Ap4A) HIT family hydrolase